MTHSAFYDRTRKRLERYGVFSERTLDFASGKAERLRQFTRYQQFFKAASIDEATLFISAQGRGVPVIDSDARGEEQGVFVVHLPMANPLDTNQRYQIAALAEAFPDYRVIAFGNPSGKPYLFREQNLSFVDWFRVAFGENRRALVSTELEYLANQNIRGAYHIGYSFGALKALTCAYYASPESIEKIILIDPVAHERSLVQLVYDFQSTFSPLGAYVNRTELSTFLEARKDAEKVHYLRGLLRSINIATALMLSRVDFISYFEKTLQKHPNIHAYVAWGSKSELGNDAHMKANIHVLTHDTARGRVKGVRLAGASHAFANDIQLFTAMVHDAVNKPVVQ